MTEKSQQNSNVVTEYYTAQDVLATSFIMVSKTLIVAKKYREPASYPCKDGTTMNFKMLSFDARFLYGVYKDRYSISVSNLQNGNTSFVDKQRRVFCYFTNDEVRFYTGWGLSKISRIKKELAAYNLMAEEAQGFNKANRIYILKSPDDLEILTAHDYKNFHEKSEKDRQDKKSDKKRKELSSLLNKGNPISVLPGKQRESQNGIPGNTDVELQEIPNRDGSNIKSININDDDENKREETDTETQQFEKSLQEVAKSELRTIFDTLAASLNNQDDIEAIKQELSQELVALTPQVIRSNFEAAWEFTQSRCESDAYFGKYLLKNLQMKASKSQRDKVKRSSEQTVSETITDDFFASVDALRKDWGYAN